jgi:hypothetical protein
VLTIFRFQGLRDRVLDHRIREIMKSDLPKYKGGNSSRLFVGADFPKGK